jgi:GNAT superfamily N-acetyltransferase
VRLQGLQPRTAALTVSRNVGGLEQAKVPPMESLVVRPARPSDASDLARNWIDVARHYAELDADAFRVPAAAGLVGWFEELLRRLRSEDAVWLVAEVDGRVVGDVAAHLEHPTEDAARQLLRDVGLVRLYVDALGVVEAYRRHGVGGQLMHAVEGWGRDRGAVRSVLTTYHASPLSVPFYEQGMGYERRSIVLRSGSTNVTRGPLGHEVLDRAVLVCLPALIGVRRQGLEPRTVALRGHCSAN